MATPNNAGLSVDYRTENITGRFMKSKATGNIAPAIRRMVENTEIEAPCVLLSEDETRQYLANIGNTIDAPNTIHSLLQSGGKEVLPSGVGSLFIKAFITDTAKTKILKEPNPYDAIEKVVKAKADMIAEIHHPALVDQIALEVLAKAQAQEVE